MTHEDNNGKLFLEIASHLKQYPFLLISMAGLASISVLPFFSDRQFGIVAWILAAVSILPLIFQVILELQKYKLAKVAAVQAGDADSAKPVKMSSAAVTSVILSAILIIGNPEVHDESKLEYLIGILIVSLFCGGLAMIGWSGARQRKVRGKGFALTGTLMSTVLILGTVGEIARTTLGQAESVPGPTPPAQPASFIHAPPPRTPDTTANIQQGINYARSGDYERAVQEFTVAIQKQPTCVAVTNRAAAYLQLKKYTKCRRDLEWALKLNPKDPLVYYNIAAYGSVTGDVDSALDAIDTALSLNFKDYDALRSDPDLENLRKNPEMRKVLEKHKVFIGLR